MLAAIPSARASCADDEGGHDARCGKSTSKSVALPSPSAQSDTARRRERNWAAQTQGGGRSTAGGGYGRKSMSASMARHVYVCVYVSCVVCLFAVLFEFLIV